MKRAPPNNKKSSDADTSLPVKAKKYREPTRNQSKTKQQRKIISILHSNF